MQIIRIINYTTKDAQGQIFIYDSEQKQTEVKNAGGATIGKYFYDGDGKRVKKYVPATAETTIFLYDAFGKLIMEYSTLTAPTPQVSYLTNDYLGSPRINTNEYGDVMARHDYQPFGEEIPRISYGSDEVRQQFTGYELDKETDLDFAQARMYASKLGRFTSTDPVYIKENRLADPQRLNLYVYVRNNPFKFVDNTGKDLQTKMQGIPATLYSMA